MKGRFFFVALLACGPWLSSDAAEDLVDLWQKKLAVNTLGEVATVMESSQSKWPHIRSLRASANQGKDSDQTGRLNTLARFLHQKIIECEMKDKTQEPTLKQIETYRKLRTILEVSGGYVNCVLVDSIDRLAVSRICGFVVKHPDRWADAERMRTALQTPRFMERNLASLLQEEMATNLVGKTVAEEEYLHVYLEALGTDERTIMLSPKQETIHAGNLIENRDLSQLVWRMAQVEVLAHVRLPALIEFLKRGGQFNEIRSGDMRRFKEVMAESRDQFKSALLHVRKIYPSDLAALLDEFGTGFDAAATYKVAVK